MAKERVSFTHLTYFYLMNFYAAHRISFSDLQRRYDFLQDTDKRLFESLKDFSKKKVSNNHENKNIAGVSFFYDMFSRSSALLPYDLKSIPFPSIEDMLLQIVSDRDYGIEGGYISGGFLDGLVSKMTRPSCFNLITHNLHLSEQDILNIFLPSDFNGLNTEDLPTIGNSRTCNTLGAVLLGPCCQAEYSEVLVLKESIYGESGWSKVYRMIAKVDEEKLPNYYSFEEVDLLTKKEIEILKRKHGILLDLENMIPINPSGRKKLFALKRDYELEIAAPLKESRLKLKRWTFLNPYEIMNYRISKYKLD